MPPAKRRTARKTTAKKTTARKPAKRRVARKTTTRKTTARKPAKRRDHEEGRREEDDGSQAGEARRTTKKAAAKKTTARKPAKKRRPRRRLRPSVEGDGSQAGEASCDAKRRTKKADRAKQASVACDEASREEAQWREKRADAFSRTAHQTREGPFGAPLVVRQIAIAERGARSAAPLIVLREPRRSPRGG